jgi:cell division protein FtsB
VLLVLQVRLWTGEGSVADVWRISKAVEAQRNENAGLQARNAALAAEVTDLKKGTAAIEERARSELGMIKEGETFFQVILPTSQQPAHQTVSYAGD